MIMLLFSNSIWGQSRFYGTLKDENEKPIVSASLILKDSAGKITAYTFSNDLGSYTLQTDKTGKFLLSISSMGFEKKEIEVLADNKQIKTDIKLVTKYTPIEEVVINSVRPIKIDGDKIIFDAKSFSQGNEEVVEDLLKKLPGLNVASDGTIKVGNQEVEKVMINGDDMFDKGYKILTKNMPVNPIDKVELLQRYSNNKHLKGIENSEKVALNLTLRKDYVRQWFGNIQAGYNFGLENRYEVRSNLMNFGNKSKYYFLTNLNNTGFDAVGDINHLIRPNRQGEPSSIGDNQSAFSVLRFGEDLPNLKKKRVNFNNAEMISANSIFTLSKKMKLKLLGFLNTDENDFYRNSYYSFSSGNTSFKNTEDFRGRKKQVTGFGKIDFTFDVSKTKTLEYTGKFNKTNLKNSSNLVFNKELLNEKLQSNNQLFDQKIVFTNKFKDNKVLLITGRHIIEQTPQHYTVNQFLFPDLFSDNANNTAQFSENKMKFTGLETHLMNRKENEDLLELKLGVQNRTDHLNSVFQLKDEETILSEPYGYQNNLKYSINDFYFSAKYRFKFNRFSLLTQADLHQLFNRLENKDKIRTQNPFFINPKIGLDWRINSKNKILTSYSYNTTNAKVLDVYNNFIQTGFRSFLKGTDDFNQLNASNFILNYTLGNWGDKFFANTFIVYLKSHDFFSTNSVISQNFAQAEKIITKNQDFFSITSNIDRYFKPIKSNVKLTLGGSQINFKNIVNHSDLRKVRNNSIDYGFEIRSAFTGIFNYHLGSKWSYNQVKTMISHSFTNNMTFLDLSFMLHKKFNFQIQSERYYFGNLDKSSNIYYFTDLEAKYILKENKLSFSLSGNNLFNTKTFSNYNLTDISISKTEYKLLPRYVLLKVEYRF